MIEKLENIKDIKLGRLRQLQGDATYKYMVEYHEIKKDIKSLSRVISILKDESKIES
jgi:hypothetical protein